MLCSAFVPHIEIANEILMTVSKSPLALEYSVIHSKLQKGLHVFWGSRTKHIGFLWFALS